MGYFGFYGLSGFNVPDATLVPVPSFIAPHCKFVYSVGKFKWIMQSA